jgi:hypothetical protein
MEETRKQKPGGRKKRPAATPASVPTGPAGVVIGDAQPSGENLVPLDSDESIYGAYLLDSTRPYVRKPQDPTHRMLRIYTLDPEVSRLDGAIATAHVPYEELAPGPIGRLFAVDLFDEVQRLHYAPVDLDDRFVLGQAGHDPSPSDPRFHAQMVYAIANVTYQTFRTALGRYLSWGSPRAAGAHGRIVLCPFGSGDRNAYYDKHSGTVHFGYFSADERVDGRNLPRGFVFTSLSHDVITHEVTHAILDGLRPRFMAPSNNDVYAFHEGFADTVALLQRFTYPDVVAAAIRQSAAALDGSALLTDIARQFGHTTGSKGALRSVRQSSEVDSEQVYDANAESHELGSVFASAIFDVFATVYRRRAARTLRIAGLGPAPRAEELSAEVQQELARKAATVARQLLTIAIRAVDLCPPVDLELGEFLRAVITADSELFRDDPWCYREAWIDAFRKREIYPSNVTSLTEDALLWRAPQPMTIPELRFGRLDFDGAPGEPDSDVEVRRRASELWKFMQKTGPLNFGIAAPDRQLGIRPAQVVSIRSSRRIGEDGEASFDLIAQVLQKRDVEIEGRQLPFYSGSTVVIGPRGEIRYVILKNQDSQRRLKRMREFATSPQGRVLWDSWISSEGTPTFKLLHNRKNGAAG